MSWLTRIAPPCLMAAALGLAACATTQVDGDVAQTPWARASQLPAGARQSPENAWVHQQFPGKAPVSFRGARVDGRDALLAKAVAAASALRHRVRVEPAELGHLRFSWKVPGLIAGADLARKDADDSPVRVILAFEGDRSTFSPRDAMLSELARLLTGEELPYATLMYVWGNKRAPGTVVHGTRTDRIRKIVLESGSGRLNQWLDYERDIRADFERAFGEPPGTLVGIALMTDSDNTRSTASAWYGPVRLTRATPLR